MAVISSEYKVKQNFSDKYDKDRFNGWSYNMRLGDEVYITSEDYPKKLTEKDPYITIKPGEFALLITYEELQLASNIMAFISIRFKYKKQGLMNVSGFHVDPNYKGKIIFSVFNAGPSDMLLKYKDPVFMIFFQQIESHIKDESPTKFDNIPTSMISEIRGQSITLANNNQKIEKLEDDFKLYGGIAVTIIVSLIGGIIAILLEKVG